MAPGALRQIPEAIHLVQEFAKSGNLIGAVCHAPQLLVSTGLVKGRNMTSWHEVANEITEAGGVNVDEPMVEDGQFITARKPGDLPMELSRVFERLQGK
ncbi:DJ-1/PfpI family protein [Neobacillus sp. MM2021_6]|nr:DJ-1/PfpI family protein [Neobacillus sp. MM2021_6]NHC21455.1 hypothetical protein [Bacillus sp. MM2020_4]